MRQSDSRATRTRARHRWARRAFLRVDVIVVLGAAVCLAVLSASSRPARAEFELTSGPGDSLTLSNSKQGAAILSLGGMRPGDSVTDTVTLGNTGTVPGDLSLATSDLLDTPGSGGGVLSGELELVINDVTNAAAPVTVYTGKIAALTPVSLGTLAAGNSRIYEFRVSFPDAGAGAENAYQGSALSVQFDWTAVNNDADTDPPETTISSGPTSLSPSRDASFAFSADESGGTFECALDGGPFAACTSAASYSGLADGGHTFSVRATDASGNTDATPDDYSWTIDATAPSVLLDDPGSPVSGTLSLNASADDGAGSGVASLIIQRSPAGSGIWTTIGASWDTSATADGTYDLRARATDNADNSAVSALRTVTVDNTAPAVSSSVPADGELVAAAGSLTIVANENVARIVNPTIDGSPAAAPIVAGSTVTFVTVFDDDPHTVGGELEDLAGNRAPIRIHFTVWDLALADYPWVEKNSSAAATMSVAATNGDAELSVPVGAWSGADPGDWLVVRIDPRPPAPVSGGFRTAGDIYDITAYWALEGTDVHSFVKALDLKVMNGPAGTVPATLENGAWRALARVPSGQTLPTGWRDGYYKVGSYVHVLTKHLSSFGLLKDVQAPSKPGGFSGSRSNGRLVLKWKAATDNSGQVDAYLVYANGKLKKTIPGSVRSASMGRYKSSDARRFQVAARDRAGNIGKKTSALVIVPGLAKLTIAQAKARLKARGLKSGALRYAFSATIPSGRVISGAPSGIVRRGSAVGLKVSRGNGRNAYSSSSSPTGTNASGGTSSPPLYFGGSPTGSPSDSPTSGSPSSATPDLPAPSGTADVESAQPQSFTPGAADEPASSLRRVLALLLLGGAFLAAGALAWHSRRPRSMPAAVEAGAGDLLFWDQRLLRATAAALRRLSPGRFV